MTRSHDPFIDWILAVEQGMPARAANSLVTKSLPGLPAINTLEDLCCYSVPDLMRLRGIGRGTAEGVRTWVEARGRKLRGV